jgi:UDP-N-acetylglucosamine/UDP-N-acetylgalactosamine 4-epimerase
MEGKIKNKRVLVTGGAGFIGSNLCEELLAQENEVVCLDNFLTGRRENISSFFTNKNFTLIEGDIRDYKVCENACNGIDIILHQAALGSVPRSINDPHTTNDINVGGFLNMLDAAKTAGIKRFVYASSSSVYGDDLHFPKVEEHIGNPLSPYAVSKQTNELYASVYSLLYEMDIVGMRYFNVFGKNQDPNGPYAAAIPRFILAVLSGKQPVIFGNGEQARDFTYIQNVIDAVQKAALADVTNVPQKVFNVACGLSISLNKLLNIIKECACKYSPNAMEIQALYEPERKGDIRKSLASINKSFEILNYKPVCNVNFGIEKTVEWYYQNSGFAKSE